MNQGSASRPRPGRPTPRPHAAALIGAALCLAAAACGGGADRSGSSGRPEAPPSQGGTARIGLIAEPSTFIDWNAGSVQDLMLADLVFRRLARPGRERGTFEPGLAESWEVLPDGKSLRFRLKGGLHWEDGREITAADVVFSESRARSEGSLATYKRRIDRVEAEGPRDVVFRFKRAYPGMMTDATLGHVYPEHLLGSVSPADLAKSPFNRKPVGSGPFRLERWEPSQYISFVPTDGPDRPAVERIVLRIFAGKEAAYREMEGGGLDYLRKVSTEFYDRVVVPGKLEGFRFPTREYLFVAWNVRRSPWDRPEVRRALTALIDRQALARRFEGEKGTVAEGPVPPGDPEHDGTLRSPPFDPAAAAAALTQAGLKRSPGGAWLDASGQPLHVALLCVAGSPLHRDTATMVADALRTGGFETEVRTLEVAALRDRVRQADFDGALFVRSDRLPVDLASCFGAGGEDNWAGLADAELDRSLAAEAASSDSAAAAGAFSAAYRRIVSLQPWTFLYYRSECTARSARLHGLEANPREPFAFADRWWIDPGPR